MGNSLTDGINQNIREGISVINGPNGVISVFRDGVSGTVSVFNNGILAYKDTEQNFFKVANNVQQNFANIAFDTEKGILRNLRGWEKDVITMLDDQGDQLQYFFRNISNKWFDTVQWSVSLAFLAFLLVLCLFGKDIMSIIDHIIKNGVKVTF